MPKKHSRKVHYHKDIRKRRLRKALRDRLLRLSLREISFRTCEADPEEWNEDCLASSPCSQGKLIKRGSFLNFAQSLEAPLSVHCVFSLYGMITIDESALQSRTKDQSLIKSLFHFHSLTEVHANPDYLLLRVRKNRDNPYPIPYIVARFKSHGDSYLHRMACKIEEIHLTFQQLSLPQPPIISDKLLEKYLSEKRGKRFMLRASPNCLVFSKELLELGGFGVDQMAQECLSYRCFVSDIFLADDYRGQIDKFFELYELGKELRSGRLKQEEYLKHTNQRQVEYIATNQQSLLTVLTEKTNLMPGLGCWEVKEIISQEHIAPKRQDWSLQAKEYQQRTAFRQVPTLSKLTRMGKNLSNFNRGLVCSYTTIATH